jgi:diguanylate cyclase (GGDEF)-like protein
MGGNLNETDALNMARSAPPGQKNPFAANIQGPAPMPQLSDEEVDHRAFFDHTTPTFNFRYALRSFRRELTRARRYGRALSVCVVIVDGLQGIMNEYGVFAAEQCVQAAAESLIVCCRADVDMVSRYADDRYMLLLPETPGTGASVLCERIRKKFLTLEIPHQWYKIKLTCSVGISYYPGHGGGVEELIAQADLAAETVQEHGGNGILYAPESPDPDSGNESETWG